MTKLAVISDVHGNRTALQAVLTDIDKLGHVDHLLNLGDLAVFGPDPAGVLTLLQHYPPMLTIMGNTDRYLVEKQYPGEPGGTDWQSQVLASFPWTADQLGPDGLAYLETLPARQYLQLSAEHAILAVHGSPRSDEENMKPDTSPAELNEMMTNTPPHNLLLCAHTHLPFDRMINGRRFVNVGSVGLPFDGDPRASYAVITLQPRGKYHIDLRRVYFDVEAVVKELESVGHPTAEVGAYNLRYARPLGSKLVYTEKMRRGTDKFAIINKKNFYR